MTWIVGIDEAGYGPNLGPFVMSVAALRLPEPDADAVLWPRLKAAVRRGGEPSDDRLFIDDSKVVNVGGKGPTHLERGVLALLGGAGKGGVTPPLLHDFLTTHCIDGLADLAEEAWYRGDMSLPALVAADELAAVRSRFETACRQADVGAPLARTVVVCPPRFNQMTTAAGSKGVVPLAGFATLLRTVLPLLPGDDPVRLDVDKLGGRNAYAAVVQDAVRDGMVVAECERAEASVYRILGLRREVCVTFRPRADGDHFAVALASMLSKYVRERLMSEFNRFWLGHVPGLKPTAGYPTDAVRFWRAIRPVAERLGLPDAAVWRCK
jgi:hypothetical protein